MSVERDVLSVLQRFQDGYTQRDLSMLDEIMELFAPRDAALMIGIGASERYQGRDQIREMIESDWRYWGDVIFDISEARIKYHGEVAWLSMHGAVVQSETHEEAMPFYLNQMKELLDNEAFDVDTRIVEAAHFGIRRWRERFLGAGYRWPFIFTAVLVKHEDGWRFHMIQWSMPVD